jgi:hypothetical protein
MDQTKGFSRPFMPYMPFSRSDEFLVGGSLSVSSAERGLAQASLPHLGNSFLALWKDSQDPMVKDLLQVIQNICDYTILVENHMQGLPNQRPPITIVDSRNYTQHCLLSLPSLQELESYGMPGYDEHYEPCRYACMIYNLLVVWPTPPIVGLYERAAIRLRRSQLGLRPSPTSSKELLVWILTMGAIISVGTPHRTWFVGVLAELVNELKLKTSQDFITLLSGYLWHPKTNTADGISLWTELKKVSLGAAAMHTESVSEDPETT